MALAGILADLSAALSVLLMMFGIILVFFGENSFVDLLFPLGVTLFWIVGLVARRRSLHPETLWKTRRGAD